YHDPAVFQQTLVPSERLRSNARFSVVAPIENNPTAGRPRLGLINESGKININELPNLVIDEEEMTYVLAGGPEELLMPIDLADLILDYIDAEDPPQSRMFGGESEFNKNAPLESLDELLNIEGVTREMLYGEEANQNGMLDPGEDLNGDGVFQPGWTAYLTVHSMESNLRSDGTEKINLNQSLLTELYDAVSNEFGEEMANFVVAYRMNGPLEPDVEDDGSGQSATQSGGQSLDGATQDFFSGVAKALTGASDGSVTRGGMDLAGGAKFQFKSIYDLVGSQVEVEQDGETTTLDSPWTEDSSDMQQYLPIIMDAFSLSDETTILGRLNINQARYETLIGLPGMTSTLANYIISQQMIDSGGQPLTDQISLRATTGWLVINGQIDVPTMRQLDQFVTARGDVFRAQVIGHFDAGGPVCRLDAVIDATQQPPKVIQLRDLTDLGRGFSLPQLIQQ
ncbi:MAG: hypothetical protein KDA84_16250, partial [Planctomycetaceae bacterium]|nr:hypothetical protein [Planctomycetaceae bacterium]